MKIIDMKIHEYIDILKSNAPAPGGGAVAGLSLSQGLSLLIMVCNLTLGKENYANFQDNCENVKLECEELLERAIELVDEDAESYTTVIKAYGLPKETPEEKDIRKTMIMKSLEKATLVPLEVVELSKKSLIVADKLIGKSNPSVATDIAVAVMNFYDSSKSAWLNVKINSPQIEDVEVIKRIKKCEKIELKEIFDMSHKMYDEIINRI